jgi:deoxyribodipyrimidine photo-lyase
MNSIFIFRRDFRKEDNTALNKALVNSDIVYPIFIYNPIQIDDDKNIFKSHNSVQFMIESLNELKKDIPISFFYGNEEEVILNIIKSNKIYAIYTNKDYSPFAIKREFHLKNICEKNKIKCYHEHDICLFEPGSILTNTSGEPYKKYTPFKNKCLTLKFRQVNLCDKKLYKKLKSLSKSIKYTLKKNGEKEFYNNNDKIAVHGGRKNALDILKNIKSFGNYKKDRDYLAKKTTFLSAYLKYGCISIREAYEAIKKVFGKDTPLVHQLIWRDFYYHLGYGYPDRFGKSFKPKYDNIVWGNNKKEFEKWKTGETGFPIVDSCMHQMNETGYMHNRGRMIVASFLIKNLQIDWKWGEKYFAQSLMDYDVLVNQGNWQWVSGSGADSQQYIRIFNPWTQSFKFDKNGEYQTKWLGNQKKDNPKEYHDEKYHNTMIDYKKSRDVTLKMYKKYL